MAEEPRIDAHLHLWQLAQGQYSWLKPGHGLLYDSFTAGQAHAELSAAKVAQAILVQADDTAADTEAMLAAAAAHDWIVGVVGWLPLEDPGAAARRLEQWGRHSAFCGVRTLLHDDPRPGFLDLAPVRRSLALLARAGVAFEVPDAFPRHLGQAAAVARELPELTVVIDHLGKPPRAGSAADMRAWETQLRAVAALPNTVAKVSGLHVAGTQFSAGALSRVWEVALEAFGAQRLMFGGDWPVSLAGAPYGHTLAVMSALVGTLSATESHAVWAGTARRIYRL
ncbi:amidohydrolase family protein [Specibacter sp. NPDC057265]|uniref:amidohydrolase family protein n=1 Tax=Specibacter sp. NPDC057265 TaxID=3346075 RepID=UPI0036320FEC